MSSYQVSVGEQEWNGMEWIGGAYRNKSGKIVTVLCLLTKLVWRSRNGMKWIGGACRNKYEKIVTVLCLLTKLVWGNRNGMEWNGLGEHIGISLGR